MGMAKVIKPALLLDKDPAKLSHVLASMSLLVLSSMCCMLGGLSVFVLFGDIELMGNYLGSFMPFPRNAGSNLLQECPENAASSRF